MINRKFYRKKTPIKVPRKKKSNLWYILYGGLALIVLLAIPVALLRFSLLNIKQVEILLDKVKCASPMQIEDLIKINNQNLLFVDTRQIKGKITKTYLCTKNVIVNKNYPNKVKINITGREPVVNLVTFKSPEASFSVVLSSLIDKPASTSASPSANLNQITHDSTAKSLVVDETGFIFAGFDGETVPKLYFEDQNLTIGKTANPQIVNSLVTVFTKLNLLNVQIDEAIVFKNDIMYIKAKSLILLDLKQDITSQLASLQLILEKAKIESEQSSSVKQKKELKVIDLRFDKPVIRYVDEGKR